MMLTKKQKAAVAREQQTRMRQTSTSTSDLAARNATAGEASQGSIVMGQSPEIQVNGGGSLLDESNGYGNLLEPDVNDVAMHRGSGDRVISSPLPALIPSAENSLVSDENACLLIDNNRLVGTNTTSNGPRGTNGVTMFRSAVNNGVSATNSPFLGPESGNWRRQVTVRIEEVENDEDIAQCRKEGTHVEGIRSEQCTGSSYVPAMENELGPVASLITTDIVKELNTDCGRSKESENRQCSERYRKDGPRSRDERGVEESADETAGGGGLEARNGSVRTKLQTGHEEPLQEAMIEDAARREIIQEMSMRASALAEHEAAVQWEHDAIERLKLKGNKTPSVVLIVSTIPDVPPNRDGCPIEVRPVPSRGNSIGTAGGTHQPRKEMLPEPPKTVPNKGMELFERFGEPAAESSGRKEPKQEIPSQVLQPASLMYYLQPGTKPVQSAARVPVAAGGGDGNGLPSNDEESDETSSSGESEGSSTDSAWGDHGDDRNGSGRKSLRNGPGGGSSDGSGESKSDSSDDSHAKKKRPSKTPRKNPKESNQDHEKRQKRNSCRNNTSPKKKTKEAQGAPQMSTAEAAGTEYVCRTRSHSRKEEEVPVDSKEGESEEKATGTVSKKRIVRRRREEAKVMQETQLKFGVTSVDSREDAQKGGCYVAQSGIYAKTNREMLTARSASNIVRDARKLGLNFLGWWYLAKWSSVCDESNIYFTHAVGVELGIARMLTWWWNT
ncbi:hypothetical protein K438DRAFT_1763267 [Mycena galopus ATCC 62051]|nr:hypothetical protein K438DRAFT_1763267 [Mycena galopus ATCC 62051]